MASISVSDLVVNYSVRAEGHGLKSSSRRVVRALRGITFDLKKGDRLAVIGVSGSGKSTLLKVLSGGTPATAGKVKIEGDQLSLLNRSAGLIYKASLRENAVLKGLSFGMNRVDAERYANECLRVTKLQDKATFPLSTMSAGMAGRFNLALNTQVIRDLTILDEWVGELGMGQLQGEGILARLAKREGIVVMASHNETLVKRFANKVLLLDQGTIVYFGADLDLAYQRLRRIQSNAALPQTAPDHDGEESVIGVHLLFPRRCGFNACKALIANARIPGYELIWHHENDEVQLSDIPVGQKLVLFYRDPLKWLARVYKVRHDKGAPFNFSPWTKSEERVFTQGITLSHLGETMCLANNTKKVEAYKRLSCIKFTSTGLTHTYGNIEQLAQRKDDIIGAICADDLSNNLKEFFASEFSHQINYKRVDDRILEHIESDFSRSLSGEAVRGLADWLDSDQKVFRYLESLG